MSNSGSGSATFFVFLKNLIGFAIEPGQEDHIFLK